ncbi:DUF6712 family protein [Siphonobacter sp. SORGH_AS_0500]|uniref:DUF6712 family protein n=1 Tax=Siphonobacter sp. SORGH_AS_0500 TaxID=1864824 RepID=UPI002861AFC1|nr:DUF6712 family protein [Siphonobacter sp. SORGH_AS_0500]MDR6195176.1 hypothetical protein [Siphonobacter sp. SORGH_AS_0500]
MLINDREILKKQLGGIQKVGDFATWEPFVRSAEQTYIIPAIGWELYNELKSLQAPNTIQETLLDQLRMAIAWFAYLEAFPHLTISIGDAGISVQTPANSQAMGKWQFVAITKEAAAKADRYLEASLSYLEKFESSFPAWKNSSAYTLSRGCLISSATEATRYFPAMQRSRRLFLNLRDYYQLAEDEFVRPILGPLYGELLAKIKAGNPILDQEAEVLQMARKAVVQYGFSQAVPYLNMNVDFRLVSETDGILNEDALSVSRLNAISQKALAEATEKAAELRNYLNANASSTVLSAYYHSGLYVEPVGAYIKRPRNNPKNPYFAL